jgi:hypothetical protein
MSATPELPVSASTLRRVFEFTYNVTLQNVSGFSHEESLAFPKDAGNPLNWVLGHIVATRSPLLQLLEQPPVWNDEQTAPYGQGSKPYADGWEALPFPDILAAFDRSQESLRAGFDAITPERLCSPLPADQNPFGMESVGEMLAAFNFHEAYHAGQTGILRRILGREGAIG